ncbi:hypothetical protein [Rhodanobacter caeni]|uniref:Uncharacterized protein n=1 Tax=Rhodanobacter caeni TaxID=657654 RepID=A0ABN0UND3_9GAMM
MRRADAAHRARVLRALGMVPWVRRAAPAALAPGIEAAPARGGDAPGACVVVLPDGCATRELDLLGRTFGACGAWLARAARLSVNASGELAQEPPSARAYLVFGETQAHALGRRLPAEVMQRAQIVLVDEPSQVLSHAASKRRLWIALRTLRRALAGATG